MDYWSHGMLSLCVTSFSAIGCYFLLRLIYVLTNLPTKLVHEGRVKTMIIAGSGGHTMEMMQLVRVLTSAYNPRIYVVASTDKMSKDKFLQLEKEANLGGEYYFETIPRSREVRQSWITTVGTTFYACVFSIPLVWKHRPDVIICNGPGTCIPICLAAFAFKVIGISNCAIVYVESICRVTTLSISGCILYKFADYLFVQWPKLAEKYPKSIYKGRFS